MARVHTTCRICAQRCGVTVTVEQNRAVHIGPDKENLLSWRDFCVKGRTAAQLVEHPRRITSPMRRQGDRYVAASNGAALMVLDPYRTATAEAATSHWRVRPGEDWAFLLGTLKVIFDEGSWRTGKRATPSVAPDCCLTLSAKPPSTCSLAERVFRLPTSRRLEDNSHRSAQRWAWRERELRRPAEAPSRCGCARCLTSSRAGGTDREVGIFNADTHQFA